MLHEILSSKKSDKLRRCFNCGGKHLIKKCEHPKDQTCIRLNRHLKDKYDTSSGKNRSQSSLMAAFKNMRYYEVDNTPTTTTTADALWRQNSSSSSSGASGASSSSLDSPTDHEYKECLKLVQKQAEPHIDTAAAAVQEQSVEQGEITDDDAMQDSENDEEEEEQEMVEVPLIGFKFENDIQCLQIMRSQEDMQNNERTYSEQLEKDKQQPQPGSRGQARQGDRDYRNMRRTHHNHNHHNNGNHSNHSSHSHSRGNSDMHRSHSRARHRNEGYDESTEIDYGLQAKEQKINRYINERYKASNNSDRHNNSRYRDRDGRDNDRERDRGRDRDYRDNYKHSHSSSRSRDRYQDREDDRSKYDRDYRSQSRSRRR